MIWWLSATILSMFTMGGPYYHHKLQTQWQCDVLLMYANQTFCGQCRNVSKYGQEIWQCHCKLETVPHFFLLVLGLSKFCFMPPPLAVWNFRFWVVSEAHGESNDVVSWSTKCVYFVLPERPKFLTCKNNTEQFSFQFILLNLFYHILVLSHVRLDKDIPLHISTWFSIQVGK